MKFPSKETVETLRRRFPKDCRVELVRMDDPQAPPVGTRGTVRDVDNAGSIQKESPESRQTFWGEDEQPNERAFAACGKTSDMELVRTRDNGSGLSVAYGEDICRVIQREDSYE